MWWYAYNPCRYVWDLKLAITESADTLEPNDAWLCEIPQHFES